MSQRLFVAISLPDAVTGEFAAMNPHIAGVRWLQRDQIHLTLSFLGKVDSPNEETLCEKLAGIRFVPFFMPIVGIGTFPVKGKPNVIWTGVGKGHPQLFHVYKRVQEAALGAGLEPDLRTWHPHISLARCRDVPPHAVRPFLLEHAEFDAGLIRVDAFSLYSSVPGRLGSVYTRRLEVRAS